MAHKSIKIDVAKYFVNKPKKPVKYSLNCKLPSGLKFDRNTGIISGMPTKPGTYDIAGIKWVVEPKRKRASLRRTG